MLAPTLCKGRDKKSQRTSWILETIALMLVDLNAFPDITVEDREVLLDTALAIVPEPIAKWLKHMRPVLDLPLTVVKELERQGVITPI